MTLNNIRSFGTRAQLAGLVLSGGWTTKKLLKTSIQTFASSNEVVIPLLMSFKLVILRKASSQNFSSVLFRTSTLPKGNAMYPQWYSIQWYCLVSDLSTSWMGMCDLAPAHNLLVPNILLTCICLPVENINFWTINFFKSEILSLVVLPRPLCI